MKEARYKKTQVLCLHFYGGSTRGESIKTENGFVTDNGYDIAGGEWGDDDSALELDHGNGHIY